MGFRRTALGDAFRASRAAGRRLLADVIAVERGNMAAAARRLFVGRRHLYKVVDREAMWGVVDRARSTPVVEPLDALIRAARAARAR